MRGGSLQMVDTNVSLKFSFGPWIVLFGKPERQESEDIKGIFFITRGQLFLNSFHLL